MRVEFIKVFITLAICIPVCKYMCNYATEEQKDIACAGMFASLCYLSVKEVHEYYKKCKRE